MKRILVVDCSGSGKSTLAHKLATTLNLHLIHLDHVYWLHGRLRPTDVEFMALQDVACQKDAWIMDGTYLRHLSACVPYGDTIIFPDLAHWQCLWHIIKRWIRSIFTHETFAPGCSQRTLTLEFWLWAWRWHKRYHGPL
jgi:adenylate kinase family enzyme